ncbi:MAG: hypothetical protein M9936_05880 [Caldilinea sp.]|nr:hypothetical protein [Caldilinea sp.]MCB9120063.1 hypothetical protein [Caldilineaceae bacterium]MCO5209201.1 hypothetical protein [Caldilinea sp.]
MIMMTTRFNDMRLRLWPFRAKQRIVIFLLVLLCLLVATQSLSAQTGGPYTIAWSAVTTASTAQAGLYRADMTVGQAEAGAQRGGPYDLGGGFWGNTTPVVSQPETQVATLYLPAIAR